MKPSGAPFLSCLAVAAIVAAAGSIPVRVEAQDKGISARTALDVLEKRFGPEVSRALVSMKGEEGQSQPEEWEIIAFDEGSPYMVREYWVGTDYVTNEGPYDDLYPTKHAAGFLNLRRLKLDSIAAFTIAEAEARRAKIGFDSLDYTLRPREFSDEPIWTLELRDAGNYRVGTVHLSGETGEVLRTVWIDRRVRGRSGVPLIIDSDIERLKSGGASTRYAPGSAEAASATLGNPPPPPLTTPDPNAAIPGPPPLGPDGQPLYPDTVPPVNGSGAPSGATEDAPGTGTGTMPAPREQVPIEEGVTPQDSPAFIPPPPPQLQN